MRFCANYDQMRILLQSLRPFKPNYKKNLEHIIVLHTTLSNLITFI